jgi:hypothetical protein
VNTYRAREQHPPPPEPVAPGVVRRLEHVYEVDPALMRVVKQHEMPVWDTERIVAGRLDYLAWMHDHWADTVLSGEMIEHELGPRERGRERESD